MNQGFQLVRSDVSEASRILGLKESIRQLSLSTQELGYRPLRIVTQFRVEQAHLYIMALPSWDSADLNDSEQVKQLEQMLTQFFYQESIKEGQLEREISVVDNFELTSQRYCVVKVTLLTSSSISSVNETTRSIRQITDPSAHCQAALQDLLSPREQEVICLIAVGLSNKQIASRLDISIWTVSAHLRRIFTKLKVDTRAAVVYQCSKLIQGWEQAYGLTDMV